MEKNLEVSNRILERLKRPLFFASKEELGSLEEGRELAFSFVVNDPFVGVATFKGRVDGQVPEMPILELKYSTDITGPVLAFIDTLVEFAIGRHEMNISLLSVREVESFLRDFNNVPAYAQGMTALSVFFQRFVQELKKALSGTLGQRPVGVQISPTLEEDYDTSGPLLYQSETEGPYNDNTMARKYAVVNQIFTRHIRPALFRDRGDIELLFLDDVMVVINYLGACQQCSKSLTTTMDFIQNVLRRELQDNRILVVTDS